MAKSTSVCHSTCLGPAFSAALQAGGVFLVLEEDLARFMLLWPHMSRRWAWVAIPSTLQSCSHLAAVLIFTVINFYENKMAR